MSSSSSELDPAFCLALRISVAVLWTFGFAFLFFPGSRTTEGVSGSSSFDPEIGIILWIMGFQWVFLSLCSPDSDVDCFRLRTPRFFIETFLNSDILKFIKRFVWVEFCCCDPGVNFVTRQISCPTNCVTQHSTKSFTYIHSCSYYFS